MTVLLALLLLCAPPSTDGELELSFPDGPVLLGEWFDVVVSGDLPDGSWFQLPALPDGVRARPSAPELVDGQLRMRLAVSLGREGETLLEGLEVVTPDGRRALPPLKLSAALDLAPGEVPRVAPFLPPVSVPAPAVDPRPFVGALLAVLLAIALWVVRTGRVIVPVVAPVPADIVATRALAALRSRIPRVTEDIPPFVDAVSDVLRAYIEQRFVVKAPEHTTEEFLAEALRHPALATRQATLEPFLTLCDLVKFARHRPGLDQVNDLLVTAERFVEDTRDSGVPDAGVEAAA